MNCPDCGKLIKNSSKLCESCHGIWKQRLTQAIIELDQERKLGH